MPAPSGTHTADSATQMNDKPAFWRAGHWPTLLSAFLYFDVSFMIWVLLGALGNYVAAEFDLSPAQKGLMTALPLASRWYPAQYQGLAMGIAGAGNSGTLLATLFAPRLAEAHGWHAVFGIALMPLALVCLLIVQRKWIGDWIERHGRAQQAAPRLYTGASEGV